MITQEIIASPRFVCRVGKLQGKHSPVFFGIVSFTQKHTHTRAHAK